jgi:VWFA-related protein
MLQSQQTEAPRFRTGTTLVELTVVALDGDGRPVIDLARQDIVVTEQGRPREVAFFRFEGRLEKPQGESLPPGLFTNRSEYAAGPPRNVTAVVLDAIHTLPGDQASVRAQLLRYLNKIEPGTRIAIYRMGRTTTVVHDFTDDLASVRARMEKFTADPATYTPEDEMGPIGDTALGPEASAALREALEAMRAQEAQYRETLEDRKRFHALASLEALGNHLAGIPGRKNMVWIGAGLPIHTTYNGFLEIHERAFRRTAQRLASQGIAIYPVDAKGLLPPSQGTTATGMRSSKGGLPPRTQVGLPDQRTWATMDLMASVTGGRVSRNTNDVSDGVKAADRDLRGAYTLAFYSPGQPDGTWHDVTIATKRRGVKLLHRQGYIADPPKPQPTNWSEEQWRWVVASPLGSSVIHLDARLERLRSGEEGMYGLLLLIAPDELAFRANGEVLAAELEIVVAEKPPSGSFSFRVGATTLTVPAGKDTADSVVRYRDVWKIKPDTSTIRLLVRDRLTGRFGTLDIPVKRLP